MDASGERERRETKKSVLSDEGLVSYEQGKSFFFSPLLDRLANDDVIRGVDVTKKFNCCGCEYRSSRKSNVTQHERTCVGVHPDGDFDLPFGCSHCKKRFSS